jgi:ankyrin repeat protein
MLIDDSDGKDALRGVWDSILMEGNQLPSLDNPIRILAYLDDINVITNSLHSDRLLHRAVWTVKSIGPELVTIMARRYMKLLKEEEYDFEHKAGSERTPLLENLLFPSEGRQTIARLLLEFGADIHAVDDGGSNALQIAMDGCLFLRNSKVTEEMLNLLIKAGADVNHCNKSGHTPSDTARKYRCWKKWCRALELSGLDISDVMMIDKERCRDFYDERDMRAEAGQTQSTR